MSDDFIAVPYPVWSDLETRSKFAAWLAFTCLILLALLIQTLVTKGTLSGWADLVDFSGKPS